MTDSTLSDHEWKQKMAAEGKAIYFPGKSVEEVRRKLDADAGHGTQLAVQIAHEDADKIEAATTEVGYLLRNASEVFGFLRKGSSLGHFSLDESGPLAVIEFAEMALAQAAREVGETCTAFAQVICEARRQFQEG